MGQLSLVGRSKFATPPPPFDLWILGFRDAIHRPMIDHTETHAPTGSITGSLLTIQSFDSRSSRSSSAKGVNCLHPSI
jgi:hypothetical protein